MGQYIVRCGPPFFVGHSTSPYSVYSVPTVPQGKGPPPRLPIRLQDYLVRLLPASPLLFLSHLLFILSIVGLLNMGVSTFMDKIKPGKAESQFSSQAATPARADSTTVEKDNLTLDDSPVKYLTWRSFILGLCVSMGGFIFGYATGKCHTTLATMDATLITAEPQVKSRVSLP